MPDRLGPLPSPPDREPPVGGARRANPGGGFRGDIQGMRALAVLAIMLFHAGYSPYPGGFVTLDVFFVVSGFLITSLLLKELARDGTISLTRFYVRRARRILPAATLVTIATLAASVLWISLVEAQDAAVDALWVAFFAGNVRFALEGTDYFAAEASPSPLQHYWSLAVEEQFYLVLPLVIVACVLGAVRRGGSARRAITLALAVVTVVSFAWSVHASVASPETAYFSTFTRTWEFGVGALLALAAPVMRGVGRRPRGALALLGLGAIVVACFTVTETTPFPGWAALLPVLGTGAVMIAGAEAHETPGLTQRALACVPLRWVGDASYSLYLWHWPVLVVASQHLGRDLTGPETLFVVAVTFALAWATYRFVETPFRRPSRRSPRRVLTLYPASVALVVASSVVAVGVVDARLGGGDTPAISTDRFSRGPGGEPLSEDPAIALVEASTRAAQQGAAVPGDLEPDLRDLKADRADLGDCEYRGAPWELCRRGDPAGSRTVVVLGNSHGRHWIPALEEIAAEAGWRAYYLVKSACTPARVATVRAGTESEWEECSDFNTWATEQVRRLAPDLVVVSGSAPPRVMVDGGATNDRDVITSEMRRGWTDLLTDLTPLAGRVAMLADVPRRRTEPGACLGRPDVTLRACLDRPLERAAEIGELARDAAAEARVPYAETEQWFCADGRCPAVVGRFVTMRDTGHVTTAYARELAEPLGRALGMLGAPRLGGRRS